MITISRRCTAFTLDLSEVRDFVVMLPNDQPVEKLVEAAKLEFLSMLAHELEKQFDELMLY